MTSSQTKKIATSVRLSPIVKAYLATKANQSAAIEAAIRKTEDFQAFAGFLGQPNHEKEADKEEARQA